MSRKWYIAQTFSGYENSIKSDIERKIENGTVLQGVVTQVLVPEKTELVEKKKKIRGTEEYETTMVEKTVKMFPGYIFIEMEVEKNDKGVYEMDDKVWFEIRNTSSVTGFLGSKGGGTKPIPVVKSEMDRILESIGLKEKAVFSYSLGDKVVYVQGSLNGYTGTITAINPEKNIVDIDVDGFMQMGSVPTDMIKKI